MDSEIPLGEENKKKASVSGWKVTLIWLQRNYVCDVQSGFVRVMLMCLGREGFVARGQSTLHDKGELAS